MRLQRSPRLLKKRRKRIVWRTIFIVLVAIVIVVGPILLLRMQFWQIASISVSGNSAVPSSVIQNLVQADINGNYIRVIPKSNILLYPKKAIETDILKIFPRIKTIQISMSGLQSISIDVTERVPTALWCQDISCYLMDSNGLIFDSAPEFNGNVYLIYKGEVEGGPIGAIYTTPTEFATINSLVDGIKALSLTPVSVNALGNNDYEITLVGGEVITVNTVMPVTQTLSNFTSLLSDPKLSLRSGNGLSVATVDLRYGNKVFFKKKGQ
jgi:cell division septal protein FtsQ